MKWEVIQMDERCANGYYVNLIRKAGEEIPEGWHLVGQAKTKAEAKEIYNANGGCFI